MPYSYYFFDPTMIFVYIGMALSLIASSMVKSTFAKYDKVRSQRGISGREAAEIILERNGIGHVQVLSVRGHLSDFYSPRDKTVNLSEATEHSTSIAAIGVSAHECGHAIQDAVGYAPLVISRNINPICSICSQLAIPIIFLGVFLGMTGFVQVGVIVFAVAISFQIITLPVEWNASLRAMRILEEEGILSPQEIKGVRAVLTAAALTYVAAAASAVLQLLRLLILYGGRRGRRND